MNLSLGDYDMRTPLHIACHENNLDAVNYLLNEARVFPSPRDRWNSTPMNDASPAAKKLLLIKGAVNGSSYNFVYLPRKPQNKDQYRLMYAAANNDPQTMENLKQIGWDVNAQDYSGRTAVSLAASQGALEAVNYLMTNGANISITDIHGYDALKAA